MGFDFSEMSLRHGLFHKEPDGISCALPGSAVSIRFQGKEITAAIEDVSKAGKNWLNIYIDDLPVRVMRIDPDSQLYQLADDLDDTEHTLTLQKRTEAAFGALKFAGLTADGGQILPPPSPRPHKIMIIGDSISCGYGNEAQIPCDCDPSRENNGLAYSTLTGKLLNAEALIAAVSGIGCYQNYGGEKEGRMSDYFVNTICPDLDRKAMDPFLPEAVVINLGTNDWTAPIHPSDYMERYRYLASFIRQRYPKAHLFCGIGPMDLTPGPYISSVVDSLRAEGDHSIHYFEFPLIDRARDGFGGQGHPSLKKHKGMAGQLADAIRRECPESFRSTYQK